MSTYAFHELTEGQVDAIRLALAFEMDRCERLVKEGSPALAVMLDDARSAFNLISQQWHAQHVAQRDAALREQSNG